MTHQDDKIKYLQQRIKALENENKRLLNSILVRDAIEVERPEPFKSHFDLLQKYPQMFRPLSEINKNY